MQHGSNNAENLRPTPPPLIKPPTRTPEWAGDLGDRLLRHTHEQTTAGVDDPQFNNVDPLMALTRWFGPGDRMAKLAREPSMDGYDPLRVRVFRASWGQRRLAIDLKAAKGTSPTITFTLDGARTQTTILGAFDHSDLRTVRPMRDFARRLNQMNKPVAPWLHTVGHHVGAESHLERSLMMVADYHPAVDHIAGQPFTLFWPEAGIHLSHTPDVVLLGGDSVPLVVDVKNPRGAEDDKWLAKLPGIRRAVQALGMGYLVWTGMSRPYRLNLENFTEARVPPDSYAFWSLVALDLCTEPITASELAEHIDANGYPRLQALTLIRRMLWRRALRTNMFTPYNKLSIVERADAER